MKLSGKCYEERSLGQTCGAWKSCTNGLSCKSTKNHVLLVLFLRISFSSSPHYLISCALGGNGKCYHNPRHFEEPCGSGAACGSGLSCAEGSELFKSLCCHLIDI